MAGLLGAAGPASGPGAAGPGAVDAAGAADAAALAEFPGAAGAPGATPDADQDGPLAGPTSVDVAMHAGQTERMRHPGGWRGPGNQAANPAGPTASGPGDPRAVAGPPGSFGPPGLAGPPAPPGAIEAQRSAQLWGDAGAASTGQPWDNSAQSRAAALPSVERAWEVTPPAGRGGPTDAVGHVPGAAGRRRSPRRMALISIGVLVLFVAVAAGLIAWQQHHKAVSTASGGAPAAASTLESPIAAVAGPASTGPVPAGFRTLTVTAAQLNTNAGFTMAVPSDWSVTTQGTGVIVEAPGGTAFLKIDLTPHAFRNMLVEATYLAAATQRQGNFPGYADQHIQRINLRGGAGAAWGFTWQDPSLGRVRALDLLYDASASDGHQSYALYMSSAATAWTSNLATFGEAMRTFRPSS